MGFSAGDELESEFSDRFWFWTGLSGKRYIHSVYSARNCPPLPGAIYVVTRRLGKDQRVPVRIGRFSPLWDFPLPIDADDDGCEIHVHLLAKDEFQTARAFDDLAAGLDLQEPAEHEARNPVPGVKQASFTQASLPLFAEMAA